jgi:hypothetical protein
MNSRQPPPGYGIRRGLGLFAAGVVLALLLGCQADEIQQYQVAHVEDNRADKMQRLLVAVFPHGETTWFFRVLGPAPVIDAHKDEFERFIQTVRFPDKGAEPITWTLPEGWKREAGNDMRFATLRFGPKDASLEAWVSKIDNKADFTGPWRLENVNRWRGQIGLKPIKTDDPEELRKDQTSKDLKIDSVAVTLFEFTGPGASSAARKPQLEMNRPLANAPQASGPPRYTVPDGWKEADRGQMAVAAFQAEGAKVKITLTPLGGPGGGLLPNVQRWREQLKLPPVSEDQLKRDIRQIDVGGAPAYFVDLVGPDASGSQRERIVGAVLPRGDITWFVKMSGPADLVGKQAAAFDAFLKSVRFDGGTGANHE